MAMRFSRLFLNRPGRQSSTADTVVVIDVLRSFTTAAGVRGRHLFRETRHLFAASLVCARATAEAIRAAGGEDVCFVITGEWDDRNGDEDIACADYLDKSAGR